MDTSKTFTSFFPPSKRQPTLMQTAKDLGITLYNSFGYKIGNSDSPHLSYTDSITPEGKQLLTQYGSELKIIPPRFTELQPMIPEVNLDDLSRESIFQNLCTAWPDYRYTFQFARISIMVTIGDEIVNRLNRILEAHHLRFYFNSENEGIPYLQNFGSSKDFEEDMVSAVAKTIAASWETLITYFKSKEFFLRLCFEHPQKVEPAIDIEAKRLGIELSPIYNASGCDLELSISSSSKLRYKHYLTPEGKQFLEKYKSELCLSGPTLQDLQQINPEIHLDSIDPNVIFKNLCTAIPDDTDRFEKIKSSIMSSIRLEIIEQLNMGLRKDIGTKKHYFFDSDQGWVTLRHTKHEYSWEFYDHGVRKVANTVAEICKTLKPYFESPVFYEKILEILPDLESEYAWPYDSGALFNKPW